MSDVIVVDLGDVMVISDEVESLIQVESADPFVISVGEQGPGGAQGLSGNYLDPVNFAYGDASPAAMVTVPANKRVYEVRIVIYEPFDGAGAALIIGEAGDPDSLVAVDEVDPTTEATYVVTLDEQYGVDTPILLTITPGAGASQGRGQVIFTIQN
jgi:hypothetical protein